MELQESKQRFIDTWGALGSVWGISKSMAQIHALLLSSINPISTDEIMEQLKMSRGNANTNIRQLMDYGIIYKKVIAGDRKEYFVAEKDVWKWSMKIGIMRKQREIDPVMEILKEISEAKENDKSPDAKEFYNTIDEIQDFTEQIGNMADKILRSTRGELLLKLFKYLM